MLKLENLVMRKIDGRQYITLREKARVTGDYSRERLTLGEGYAQIIKPLDFKNYEKLLTEFKDTDNARCASIKIAAGNWERTNAGRLDHNKIKKLSDQAREMGFLYISFRTGDSRTRINNEIGFEASEGMIKSVDICIPGDKRNLYGWEGSNDHFTQIRGIYLPEDL